MCFNLGYLPGADKAATPTSWATTAAALDGAARVLAPGGIISVLCYTGHEGGGTEYEGVRQWAAARAPAAWITWEMQMLNRPGCPVLVLVYRRVLSPREGSRLRARAQEARG